MRCRVILVRLGLLDADRLHKEECKHFRAKSEEQEPPSDLVNDRAHEERPKQVPNCDDPIEQLGLWARDTDLNEDFVEVVGD